MAEGIAEDSPFCSEADEGGPEEGKRAQRSVLKSTIDEYESWSTWRLQELVIDFERGAKITKSRNAAEALGAEFQ